MNNKVLIGVGLIVAGGYLLWKQNQKKTTTSMIGIDGFTTKVIGDRSKRGFVASNLPPVQSPFRRFVEQDMDIVESHFDETIQEPIFMNFAEDNMNIQSSNWM
jgi:hypothetical protein